MTRPLRHLGTIAAFLCVTVNSQAQVPSPKHESGRKHIFAAHRDMDNLQERFEDLKCSLLLIEAGQKLGTGFYIDADGDIATASHVLGERKFSLNPQGQINVEFALPPVAYITDCKGTRTEISLNGVEKNPDAWVSDVAKVKTGKSTKFWLREFDDRKSHPGEHLIAMGFPGLSFQALTIYTGILSARLSTNLPTVILDTGQALAPQTEFLRVQMPISTGLSGAPVIDDENRVIGIVTNAGGWSKDLDNLMMAFHGGAFQAPAPPPSQDPNVKSFSFNPVAVIAELAGLFHDYASPGYGDAVPMRYLRKPPQQNLPSASLDH